ncbi:hydroxyacid dehydrogenase [Paenibacillus pasadenensis]|uniref:hydroxyacid dehydrogenase n=1 Tax=Paenibacillus pasadenensis TaxID=217090 RepID=UPI00203F3E48|nr:hydroxyacid dehydrogenase [Paenibacillus pasadenensis]MCM3748770.1 hydroxyacid dehydrogenase [Paenibacillus pasadenensis]
MKAVITELNWPVGIELLEEAGWNVLYDPVIWQNRERLKAELHNADVLIVRNQTKVDQELLGWGSRLRAIGRLGVGLDNIDLQAASEREIPVIYGKNANATSVAEYVISGIFAASRLLREADTDVKNGGWNRRKYTGTELFGKTLGLIGVGEIGHRVAVRARALGLHVVGYDPFVAPYDFPAAESGIQLADLKRVLAESDYISLHVPLTADTRYLLNRDAFHQMKPGAVLINSARGGIVHEHDLNDALQNGTIAGAILDVLEQEPPPPDHPLLQRDNCLITPHIAGLTEESQVRTAEMVSREIIGEIAGRRSLCRVAFRR